MCDTQAVKGGEKRVRLPTGKELNVKIPAGVVAGQQIRLKGQGDTSPGHAPGDLLITVNGETLLLDPCGAAFAPAHSVLLFADLHFEKGSFYARGRQFLLPERKTTDAPIEPASDYPLPPMDLTVPTSPPRRKRAVGAGTKEKAGALADSGPDKAGE